MIKMNVCAAITCQKEFMPNPHYKKGIQKYCSQKCYNDRELKQTKEQLEKLEQLANRQQDFSLFIPKLEFCEICFSKESLVTHEISYYPLETTVLCASCHSVLHLRFLKRKKVRPRKW